jgi:molybdate transport system permease protein
MTVRKVSLPLAAPFVIAGLGLAWARALGEFGATILFAGNLKGVTQTMPLAVYVGFESDMDQAKALAIVLLVTAVVVMVATRIVLGRRMTFAH